MVLVGTLNNTTMHHFGCSINQLGKFKPIYQDIEEDNFINDMYKKC
jgi:hypothetical protein